MPEASPKRRLMKDGLGPAALERIAQSLERASSAFSGRAFMEGANCGLSPLELKDRVRHVSRVLRQSLHPDWPQALEQLNALPQVWDPGDPDDPLRGFAAWPVIDLIGAYGLSTPRESLEALFALTGLFTAEFAIRPFLQEHPEHTLEMLFAHAFHDDAAVRRLCSEGTRPRLPWGQRVAFIDANPEACLALIALLRDDSDEVVRRSVANHLNDWSRIDPDWTADVLARWWKGGDSNRQKLVRHAARNLVKAGHPTILDLFGKTADVRLGDIRFEVSPRHIKLGDTVNLSLRALSTASMEQHLVVDFVVHHQKANGRTAPKVFKWREFTLAKGGSISLKKSHSVRPITTRRYHPGRHRVEVVINGQKQAEDAFELKMF
jgi:3-methyladenine DNA glycosylase AlkC